MSSSPAAIVGIACRVPGAPTAASLWDGILRGREPFAALPPERFDGSTYASELPEGHPRDLRGASLESFEIDWRGLRITPLQVARMHRMEKLALVTMSAALADAGIRPGGGPIEKGQIWVAASGLAPDPLVDHMRRIRRFELAAPLDEALASHRPRDAARLGEVVEALFDRLAPPIEPDSLATSASIIAGRVANLFDFRGGHGAVDAAMASSLAAVERALVALESGACDLALVCAISPLLTPSSLLAFAHRRWLTEGSPRPFAPGADGTLLGEGCVAVALRRREEVGSGRVYALVEAIGSSIAPGGQASDGLAECTRKAAALAMARAHVAPPDVDFVESRACGVPDVDRAEALGLADAYRSGDRSRPLSVTSSVPNAGFLQSASGMLALVKSALALHHRTWPAQTGGRELAPAPGVKTADSAVTWEGPRRVGVSDAGPDAIAYHAILASADAQRPARAPSRPRAGDGVAIVGAGLLVPRANDVETYWRNALAGVDAIGDLPRSRWDVDRLAGTSSEVAAALKTRLAGTLDIPPLDAARFGLDPALAARLDPAIVLALLSSDEALRSAGWRPDSVDPDRVQVVFGQLPLRFAEATIEKRVLFAGHLAVAAAAMREAGVSEAEVAAIAADTRARFDREVPKLSPESLSALSGLPCALRVAAAFGFRGGALSIDAACASSLAAIETASEALLRGDADAVVAGGIAYNLLPEYYVALSLLGALSARGGHPFHRDAEGFVPAEGAGAVVLKRLADARASGDRIYAVIRGHGASSDGRGLSIYAPSTQGQQLAIRRALEAAGIAADEIDHVESHGTATKLGDRTEVESYAAIYGRRQVPYPLSIGAAKSQVGHASSAAGMVALVRAALALRERVLPPSNGSGDLEPELGLGRLPMDLSLAARAWTVPPGRRRRAAVSAFGLGGVNHHVVLEEASSDGERGDAAAPGVPMPLPPRGLRADRFVVELSPVSLPERPPTWPLRGKRILVAPGAGALGREIQAGLVRRGAEPVGLDVDPEAPGDEMEASAAAAIARAGGIDGVIDLCAFGASRDLVDRPGREVAAAVSHGAHRAFGLLRASYDRLARDGERACYVAVTSIGGDLGLAGGAGNPIGALHAGLAKALKQEVPGLVCKAIDFDPAEPAAAVAESVLREIEDAGDRIEVAYAGRRYVATLKQAPFVDGSPAVRPIRAGDVFLLSGGGRGVVFECARALAALGVRVVTTGRTPPPDPAAPWVSLDDAAFAEYRTREIARRRAERPGVSPAHLVRELDELGRQRELHANLERARAAGLPLSYEVCDITDPDAVRALVERVRSRHGRIDGVVHGAMVEQSGSLPRKSPRMVERTLLTKVAGLVNLLDATAEEPLRVVVAFGSGAGRFGNAGQTDYAAANALMSVLLAARAGRRSRPVHSVTIDWPAWESVGWVASNPEIAARLRSAGATSISTEEGIHWFLSELALGTARESVILEERMLHDWPFLGRGLEGRGERAVEVEDRGAPIVPGRWPMLDHVVERGPGRILIERRLDPRRDLVLPQHRIDGTPILPAAFGWEMLAEAAALACPGLEIAAASDLRIETPLKLFRGEPLLVQIDARVVEERREARIVEAETRSILRVKGREIEPRVHHRGRFVLAGGGDAALRREEIPDRPGVAHARSYFHLGKRPLDLGPLLSRAAWVQIFEREATGTIHPPDPRRIFAGTSHPVCEIDPLLMDAAFHVAGSWDGHRNGWVPVPLGIGRVEVGRKRRVGERARVRACVAREADRDVYYDVLVVGDGGDVLLDLSQVHLRRIGAVAGPPS